MAPNTAVTDTRWSPNFSSGRPAGDPTEIDIHHWGDDGQDHEAVVRYLCRDGGNTSAHYVVSAGRVTQLVHDYDRAWHAGPSGNPRGIGIECRPEMSTEDFESVAQLVAAIRREWGPLALKGHKDHMATACPGRYYPRLAELSARADEINNGAPASPDTPSPAAKPSTKPPKIDTDEYFGPDTQKAWARINGTLADGVISSQDSFWRPQYGDRLTCVEWVPSSQAVGSSLIGRTQRFFKDQGLYTGALDGLIGPEYVAAFIAYYGGGTFARAIGNLQRAINRQNGY